MPCKSALTVACLICLLALTSLPVAAQAADVPQWSTYCIQFTASGSSSNWYTDPAGIVSATFTGPGGITKTVTGFWNGDNVFDIRFTPAVQGDWTYTTDSPNAGLNNQSGSLNAVAPNAGNHGFLRSDPDNENRTFVWDDGTRYFMWGQTYDDIVQTAMAGADWKTGIDNSLAHGMTKVRITVLTDSSTPNYTGHDTVWSHANHGYPYTSPYVGADSQALNKDQLNFAYWNKLDEVLAYLDSKGMVAELTIFHPYNQNNVFGTDAQNDRFLKYVVARYAAYHNVTWNLSYEWVIADDAGHSNPQDQNDFNHFGSLVRANDPWIARDGGLRPLSVHNCADSIVHEFLDAAWSTSVSQQYHRNGNLVSNVQYGDVWGNAGILANLGHGKPVVNDEYAYIGGNYNNMPFTQTVHRNAIWGVVTAGGFGSSGDGRVFTDGSNQWIAFNTGDWANAPQYDDIKHMVDFFTTKGIQYWKMTSHNELKTSGTRTYVLAEPGRQYVAYLATGGTFALSLPAGEYYAYRYNPRTGETSPLPSVAGGGAASFTMPDSNDWVVHLSTSQEVPEPGSCAMLGEAVVCVGAVAWRRQGVRRP